MAKSFSATLLLLIVLPLCFTQSIVPRVQYDRDIRKKDKDSINFAIESVRGFWSGFNKGFFNNGDPLTSQCLGESTVEGIIEFYAFLYYGQFADMFKVFQGLGNLYVLNYK